MKKLVVEKDKLIENINIIKNKANGTKIIGVVKFNGYGLGIIELSKLLIENGIDFLAVSTVEEAIYLRENNINVDVLMLSSTSCEEEVKLLIENDIILSIGSFDSAKVAEKLAKKLDKKVRCHIKLDTGFGRFGFYEEEASELVKLEKSFKNIVVEGHFSHFSSSYCNDKYTLEQFENYNRFVDILEENGVNIGIKHICNSSAFVKFPDMYMDAVRIGSAFLGRLSFKSDLSLNKIAYMESCVSEIKQLPKGHFVGYGNVFSVKKDTKAAIISLGGLDGFKTIPDRDMNRPIDKLRYLYNDIKFFFRKNYHYVKINDKITRILGRIGKGQIICDISDSEVKVGDVVTTDINPLFVDSRIKREYRENVK